MEYNNSQSQRKRNNKSHQNVNFAKNNGLNEDNNESEVIGAFNYFDINQDGKININEIKKVLTSLGDNMTEEEFDNIFKSVDINVDNNGFMDYIEFINLWKNNE